MEVRRNPITTYLEDTLWAVLQEGVLPHTKLSASNYLRSLILQDVEKRGLLTPEIKDLLIGHKHENSAA